MRVLLYSGQYDVICHHLGTERMLNHLDWNGRQKWQESQPGVWVQGNNPFGYLKSYANLQFLLFLDSGHMVILMRYA